MSSPWAKISAPEPLNLKEIISEEIIKENKKCFKISNNFQSDICEKSFDPFDVENQSDPDTDAVIAKLLQEEYDEEYQDTLNATKKDFNYASLFLVSDNNIQQFDDSDFESNLLDEEEIKNVDEDEENSQHSDEIISKYDIKLKGSPPTYSKYSPEVDDCIGEDFKLSDKVCNSLKIHFKREQNRREKLHDRKENNATAEFALDFSTRLQLHKFINKQLLENVNGIISVGKEAVVLHANSDQSYPDAILPKECAVKIYKTTLADFKQREIYIREDKRFASRIGKQSTRKTIYLWAEKELRNLFRLQKAGIPCPQPIALKQHVLVMSFIGENHCPAPKLKHAKIEADEYELAYCQVVEAMKNLYHKAKLIHADLSEYNILWHNKQCYFIDVSQSVEPTSMDAFYFLMRDCENISKFFSDKEIPNMKTAQELFTEITDLDYCNRVQMEEACKLSKSKPNVMDECDVESNNIFETEWQKITEEQSQHCEEATKHTEITESAIKSLHV